jgi:A/G-specific adenine glycosylase
VARHASRVLLVQRPPSGIWGGLWCLPEFDSESAAEQFASSQFARLPGSAALPDIEHSFTHFDLVITPLVVRCQGARRVNEATELWYDLAQPARVGLPAPIKMLLGNLAERMES